MTVTVTFPGLCSSAFECSDRVWHVPPCQLFQSGKMWRRVTISEKWPFSCCWLAQVESKTIVIFGSVPSPLLLLWSSPVQIWPIPDVFIYRNEDQSQTQGYVCSKISVKKLTSVVMGTSVVNILKQSLFKKSGINFTQFLCFLWPLVAY